MSSEREEAEWMRRAQNGDSGAFCKLWERYKRQIEAYCIYHCVYTLNLSRQDAEDAALNTFVQAWSNRGQYRYPEAPKMWLFAIAKNECRQAFRKQMNQPKTGPLDEAENVLATGARGDPVEAALNNPLPELIDTLKNKLTEEEMVIFRRRFEQGWTGKEIAAKQEKNESTMRSSIAKIQKKAKEVMNSMGYHIN